MTLEGTVNIVFSPRMRTALILQGNRIFIEADITRFIRNCTYKLMTKNHQLQSIMYVFLIFFFHFRNSTVLHNKINSPYAQLFPQFAWTPRSPLILLCEQLYFLYHCGNDVTAGSGLQTNRALTAEHQPGIALKDPEKPAIPAGSHSWPRFSLRSRLNDRWAPGWLGAAG